MSKTKIRNLCPWPECVLWWSCHQKLPASSPYSISFGSVHPPSGSVSWQAWHPCFLQESQLGRPFFDLRTLSPTVSHRVFWMFERNIFFSDLRMMLVFRPPGPKCCPEMARILFSTVSTATDVCRAVFTAQRCKQVSFDCESCDPSSWLSPQANTVPLLERANVEFLESHWNQIGSSKQRCLQRSSGLYRCFQAF